MQPYVQLNAHCIGKSHLANARPCEDYSLSYADVSLSAAVISDGHGDANCFRSAAGAKFACEISVNLLRQFQGITSHITDIRAVNFEQSVQSLEREIASKWKKKVLSDAAANPFTQEELGQASEAVREQYRSGQNVERAYGCTLIAAMVTRRYFLCVQIGDGNCVSAYPGGIFVEPVPPDENCVGNRSTSLCGCDAETAFRHYYSDILPTAVFVSSDGVQESFDPAGLYGLFYSVAFWSRSEGAQCALQKLTGLLPQISEGGSGDDVSVSCFVSAEGELSAPRKPLSEVYRTVSDVGRHLERIDGMIAAEKDKIQQKTDQIEKAESELASLKKTVEEKETSYYAACDECDALKAGLTELCRKREAAAAQTEKAQAFRESAERFWFSEYRRLGINGRIGEDAGETPPEPVPSRDLSVKTVFESDGIPRDDSAE